MFALAAVAILLTAKGGDPPRLVCDGVSWSEANEVVSFRFQNSSLSEVGFAWRGASGTSKGEPNWRILTESEEGWVVAKPRSWCGNGLRGVTIPASATARWKIDASYLRQFGEEVTLSLLVFRTNKDKEFVGMLDVTCVVDLTGVPEPNHIDVSDPPVTISIIGETHNAHRCILSRCRNR